MSNATELLRLVVHEITAYGQVTYKTLEQIENILAAEPEAEPFGYVSQHKVEGPFEWQFNKELAEVYPDTALSITPVYLHSPKPEPARKPMTEEYIRILYGDDNNFELTAPYVIAFARAVERYHGIDKDDEFCDSHCTWLDHHPDCKKFTPKTEVKSHPLVPAIGQAVKITENGDHIAYEIFDGDKWLRLEPARKPMTDREISEAFYVHPWPESTASAFAEGIRFAEKHHGITASDLTLQDQCRGDKL